MWANISRYIWYGLVTNTLNWLDNEIIDNNQIGQFYILLTI